MTWPWPMVKVNGFLPRSHDASNCLPPLNSVPTYWTLTVSPVLASVPEPVTTSEPESLSGALPVALGTDGFLVRSVLTPVTLVCWGSGSPGLGCATDDLVEA